MAEPIKYMKSRLPKVCKKCGGPLPEGCSINKQYCDACAYERKLEIQRERERQRRMERRIKAGKEPKPKAVMTLTDYCREAKKLHMSYGQYTALLREAMK